MTRTTILEKMKMGKYDKVLLGITIAILLISIAYAAPPGCLEDTSKYYYYNTSVSGVPAGSQYWWSACSNCTVEIIAPPQVGANIAMYVPDDVTGNYIYWGRVTAQNPNNWSIYYNDLGGSYKDTKFSLDQNISMKFYVEGAGNMSNNASNLSLTDYYNQSTTTYDNNIASIKIAGTAWTSPFQVYVYNGTHCPKDAPIAPAQPPFCLNCEQHLATGKGDYNFSIHRYSTIYNFTVDMKGENHSCYQESANVSTSCGGLNTGSYAWINYTGSSNVQRWVDGLWDTGSSANVFEFTTLIVNYSIPSTFNAAVIQHKGPTTTSFNNSLNSSCFKKDLGQVSLRYTSNWTGETAFTIECYNGSEYIRMFYNHPEINFYEEAIWWYGYPSNLTVFFNNSLVYNFTGELNQSYNLTMNLSLNYTQNYIDACSNPEGRNCKIPLTLNWTGGGAINISYRGINWYPWRLTYDKTIKGGNSYDWVLKLNVNTTENASASLVWNNTNLGYTNKEIGIDYLNKFTMSYTLPIFNTLSSITPFYWIYNISYDNATSLLMNRTLTYNQTYSTAALYNCNDTRNATALNISIYDEISLANMTADIQAYFKVWTNPAHPENYLNYSFSMTGATSYSVCMFPPNETLYTDAFLLYSAYGYNDRTYYLLNATLTNTTQYIFLYMLNASGERINVYVYDQDNRPIVDSYVKALRFYPNESVYRIVEISKTDVNGQAALTLERFSPLYKFFIQTYYKLLKETNPDQILLTTIYFNLMTEPDFLEQYNKLQSLDYACTFNNATKTFSFSYNDLTGTVLQGCLEVTRRTALQETTIYDQCVASNNAVLQHTLAVSNETGVYTGKCYVNIYGQSIDKYLVGWEEFAFDQVYKTFGKDGAFFAVIIVGSLATIAFFNAGLAVIMAIVGLVASAAIGFIYLPWAILVTLVIAGMIYYFKIKS